MGTDFPIKYVMGRDFIILWYMNGGVLKIPATYLYPKTHIVKMITSYT